MIADSQPTPGGKGSDGVTVSSVPSAESDEVAVEKSATKVVKGEKAKKKEKGKGKMRRQFV